MKLREAGVLVRACFSSSEQCMKPLRRNWGNFSSVGIFSSGKLCSSELIIDSTATCTSSDLHRRRRSAMIRLASLYPVIYSSCTMNPYSSHVPPWDFEVKLSFDIILDRDPTRTLVPTFFLNKLGQLSQGGFLVYDRCHCNLWKLVPITSKCKCIVITSKGQNIMFWRQKFIRNTSLVLDLSFKLIASRPYDQDKLMLLYCLAAPSLIHVKEAYSCERSWANHNVFLQVFFRMSRHFIRD